MLRDFFAQHDVFIKLFLLIGFFVVGGLVTFDIFTRPKTQTVSLPQNFFSGVEDGDESSFEIFDTCGVECERKIHEVVSLAVATISGSPQQTPAPAPKPVASPTPAPKQTQISYVPIGGTGSTTNNDWTSLQNTDFFLDTGEYGKVKESRWSANIKLKHASGEGFARLFDVTHSVAVPGSEISTTRDAFTLVESGTLIFLGGKNVYRVQIKSLSSVEVTFDAGRVKIISE